MIQLSNLKLAAQNPAPSRMSDLQFDGIRQKLVYGTYQTPGVEKGVYCKRSNVVDVRRERLTVVDGKVRNKNK